MAGSFALIVETVVLVLNGDAAFTFEGPLTKRVFSFTLPLLKPQTPAERVPVENELDHEPSLLKLWYDVNNHHKATDQLGGSLSLMPYSE